MTRVALLTEIPAPYRIPLFNALAARVELHVLFLRERHPERPYELHRDELRFDWEVVPGIELKLGRRWILLNRSVRAGVRTADAVLLGGWNQPAFWEALAVARARRVPLILWSESTGRDRRSGRHERVKSLLLRVPTAFIVPGAAARDYLEALGAPPERIVVAPNAVDAGVFGAARPVERERPLRLLTVARLSEEKGIDTLLEAAKGLPIEVVLAGSGPEEERLRRLAGSNVTFLGNVPRDELPALYAGADVAVAPSRSDTWGMTLNEAALAGLPLISTTAAGAAWELIEEGVNGFRVPPEDAPALRQAILRFVEDEAFRRSAGARSREIVARFTPDAWADAVVGAMRELEQ